VNLALSRSSVYESEKEGQMEPSKY
jgi:hypothetical protein